MTVIAMYCRRPFEPLCIEIDLLSNPAYFKNLGRYSHTPLIGGYAQHYYISHGRATASTPFRIMPAGQNGGIYICLDFLRSFEVFGLWRLDQQKPP